MLNIQIAIGRENAQSIENIIVDSKYFDNLILGKYPSIIDDVIVQLFACINSETPFSNSIPAFNPEDKISHNNIVKYKEIIYAYGEYTQSLDKAYEALDSDSPGRKNRILFFINSEYLKIVGELLSVNGGKQRIDVIRENADLIIERVIQLLTLSVANGNENISHLSKEDLVICITTIACHAFVECKILENPNIVL